MRVGGWECEMNGRERRVCRKGNGSGVSPDCQDVSTIEQRSFGGSNVGAGELVNVDDMLERVIVGPVDGEEGGTRG